MNNFKTASRKKVVALSSTSQDSTKFGINVFEIGITSFNHMKRFYCWSSWKSTKVLPDHSQTQEAIEKTQNRKKTSTILIPSVPNMYTNIKAQQLQAEILVEILESCTKKAWPLLRELSQ